jgi:phosphate transport system permease protein
VLFLGAVVLFAMTFVMNTFAELLRQRLRERNKTV